jgi:hypothetical protein
MGYVKTVTWNEAAIETEQLFSIYFLQQSTLQHLKILIKS